jgi:hypothetical protein
MERDTELKQAKERAAKLRKEIEISSLTELGFENALEFIQYHWDKLTPEDREVLRRAGVKGPRGE